MIGLNYYLGIDIGSLSLGLVLMDQNGIIIRHIYVTHQGNISACLQEKLPQLPVSEVSTYACNQKGSEFFNDGFAVNEQVAIIEGAKFLYPDLGSLISIGAETFGLFLFDENKQYKKSIANSACAAGTGGFLDQQAQRLALENSAELSRLAARFRGQPPPIATRCAVFAKTDLIHCQQQGHSLEAICAGLCQGLAQNIADTLVQGAHIPGPVVAVGGVSQNSKVMDYLSELIDQPIRVPNHAPLAGAVGCSLAAKEQAEHSDQSPHISLNTILREQCHQKHYFFPPLSLQKSDYPDFHDHQSYSYEQVELDLYQIPQTSAPVPVYLGIDIGSTSTKAMIMRCEVSATDILVGLYTRTRGQPIQATQQILRALQYLQDQYHIRFDVRGVGTTGSGRKFIKKVIQADLAIDEITAHARAAYSLNPQIDTIIEIGGQDSKFTVLKNGQVTFSVMNYVCAAGTGSFIEEQALRLGVSLDDFSDLAMNTPAPLSSDRCTVFMERDLNHFLSQGYSRQELLAAALHSVRDNYLSKVARQNKIGQTICFQGATAKNKALVAAFEQQLQRPIHVSRYCHLTGALGVCLFLREQSIRKSTFRGIAFYKEQPQIFETICEDCKNHCKLINVRLDRETVTWGYLCGKDDRESLKHIKGRVNFDLMRHRRQIFHAPVLIDQERKQQTVEADKSFLEEFMDFDLDRSLSRLRENLGMNVLSMRHSWFTFNETKSRVVQEKKNIRIGLPNTLYVNEYMPFWKLFFSKLGYQPVISEQHKSFMQQGKKIAGAEFCAPMASWHGHISHLIRSTDYVFTPQMIEGSLSGEAKYYCYYSNYAVPLVRNNQVLATDDNVIAPLIDFSLPPVHNIKQIYESLPQELKLLQTPGEIHCAFLEATSWFNQRTQHLKAIFKAHLESRTDLSVVLLGRPYVVFDASLNKGIPDSLNELGISVFFQDMLPDLKVTGEISAGEYLQWNHWYYGDKIMQAAEYIGRTPGLYAVYITAFKCSPDAFLLEYFKEIMDTHQKPYLILQIDEHGSAVGYETRLESAVRTFREDYSHPRGKQQRAILHKFQLQPSPEKIMLVPNYDSLSCRLICAAFEKAGFRTLLLEETPTTIQESIRINDGQCLPIGAIVQSTFHTIRKQQLDPGKTILFINALTKLSCNFPQYPLLIKRIIEQQPDDLKKIQVYATDFDLRHLPFETIYDVYCSYALGGFLRKLGCKIRPYELQSGQTNQVIEKAKEMLFHCISKGESKEEAFQAIVDMFTDIPVDKSAATRPKVSIIGDLYVRDNEAFNQNLVEHLEACGAEVITTPFSYVVRLVIAKINHAYWQNKRYFSLLRLKLLIEILTTFEKRFFQIANKIIKEEFPVYDDELINQLGHYNISLAHGGETAQNVLKILSLVRHFPDLQMIIHVNPIFCCPGMVSESLFKKIEKDIRIPIISLIYDGTTTNKNDLLTPYLHYITGQKTA